MSDTEDRIGEIVNEVLADELPEAVREFEAAVVGLQNALIGVLQTGSVYWLKFAVSSLEDMGRIRVEEGEADGDALE